MMKTKTQIGLLLALAFFLFCQQQLAAQLNTSDSLKSLISNMKGSDLANLYLDLGERLYLETGEPDSILYYSKLSLQESIRIGDKKNQLYAHKYLSGGYAMAAEHEESYNHLDTALILARELKDQYSIADIYNKFGYNYQLENRSEDAITVYIEAAQIFETIGRWEGLALAYHNISGLLNSVERPKEAKLYVEKMILLLDKINDPPTEVSTLSFIASSYSQYGIDDPIYLDSAEFYALKGLKIGEENHYYNICGEMYCALGSIETVRKNFEKSEMYFHKALTYPQLKEVVLYSVYQGLHRCYYNTNELHLAEMYLDSMADLPITFGYESYRVDYLRDKYALFRKKGNYFEALTTLESLKELEDSIFNADRTARISELELQYNSIKNESTINNTPVTF